MPATETLHDEVAATLKRLQAKNPGLKQQLQKAHGYAVFPSVGKASLVVGGSYGRGEVFEKGKVVGTATISQFTVGVQVGGDTFTEIVIFDGKEALERFKQGKTHFAANASTVLVKAGATGTKGPEKGAKAYAYSRGGMLLEVAIGGQKFKFKPADEQDKDPGKSGGQKGKSQQGKAGRAQSGRQEEGEEEGQDEGQEQSGGMLSKLSQAKDTVKNHPILSALAGAVAAAGLVWYASRGLRAGSQDDDESDDRSEEEGDDEGQAQDRADDESEDDSDDEGDEDEGNEQAEDSRDDDESDEGEGDEGDQQDEGGSGFLSRWRSRA